MTLSGHLRKDKSISEQTNARHERKKRAVLQQVLDPPCIVHLEKDLILSHDRVEDVNAQFIRELLLAFCGCCHLADGEKNPEPERRAYEGNNRRNSKIRLNREAGKKVWGGYYVLYTHIAVSMIAFSRAAVNISDFHVVSLSLAITGPRRRIESSRFAKRTLCQQQHTAQQPEH